MGAVGEKGEEGEGESKPHLFPVFISLHPHLSLFFVFPGYPGAPATCPEIPLLFQWHFGAQEFKEGLEIPNTSFNRLNLGEGSSVLS